MEKCHYCKEPVEDSPPNIPIHAECLYQIFENLKKREIKVVNKESHVDSSI